MLLALDISTSCTGWSVFDKNGIFQASGNIQLSKIKDFFQKCKIVKEALTILLIKFPVEKVAIEENLQAFRPGLSSAKTLMTLAQFNGIVQYICTENFDWPITKLNVNTARKSVGLKIDKKDKSKTTKEKVWEWVDEENKKDNFKINWPMKELKSGPNKGTIQMCNEAYDMADSYVIGKAYFNLLNE